MHARAKSKTLSYALDDRRLQRVLQFVDAWTNNFAYVGRRATGTAAGSFLLVPQYGSYTKVAEHVGFPGINFFSGNLILMTIILIVIWEVTGYNMVIFYTALKAVPREVIEAAILDG